MKYQNLNDFQYIYVYIYINIVLYKTYYYNINYI